ncbi:MAG: helicase-related protein [Legionella sp.]
MSTTLTNQCERLGVPNEFFPHHGNLAKELREPLEQRLQEGKLPTTAICTATLELGIDIGSVDSVAQVNPPFSVASFRQRIGRSGRRGNEAVVRIFIIEHEINGSSCWLDNLRLDLVQSIAIVSLLHKKWYEPPETMHYHLSTLVQQILAVIGQYGSARANQLWLLLCDSGPFNLVSKACFVKILKSLADKQLIAQNSLI